MTQREQFEAWAKRACYDVRRTDNGFYPDLATFHAWEAWQAADAAKDAELQQLREIYNGLKETIYNTIEAGEVAQLTSSMSSDDALNAYLDVYKDMKGKLNAKDAEIAEMKSKCLALFEELEKPLWKKVCGVVYWPEFQQAKEACGL